MSTTAVIAEDEGDQRREMKDLLAELWPDLVIVAECADGLEAIEAIQDLRPDIVFLDIRMPGMSGLEAARIAGNAHVVFVTAYDEFAVRAFEKGAVDYLLKPMRRERLIATVTRLKKRINDLQPGDTAALLEVLRTRLTQPVRWMSWIAAGAGEAIRMISVDDVLAFRSEDKYTCVLTASGSAHIRTPLKELIGQLDPEVFWQVHRSAIVRVSAIRTVHRDDDGRFRLNLDGCAETVPVSAAFQGRFRPM